ncbi:MAG: HAD family hydrolase [Candidatus Omnitrophica bacterium]|nr:HAD family hydrolase [Candidatus Omnitrophota bacterium]
MGIKVVFLDRDGVINKYPGDTKYVTSLKNFRLLPGVRSALRKLSRGGYKMFVISNQAGVSKKIYSQRTLDIITNYMVSELKKSNAVIDGVYYCIHRSEDNCPCRKPKDGLIKKALKENKIPRLALKNAFFVGDSVMDLMAAKQAGCKSILVFSGKEKPANSANWETRPDFTAENLPGAVKIILKNRS